MNFVKKIALLFLLPGCAIITKQEDPLFKTDQLIYKDDFSTLSNNWIIETPKHKDSKVYVNNNKLIIDVAAGATVWLNKPLSGNYMVSYKRKVIVDKGLNDRLSDFNQFWNASDPKNSNLFTRTGVFEEYDQLSLYYIGMGGNTNKTTRFRKYYGNGTKPLLKEYTDKEHLLQANREYLVVLIVKDGLSEFYVDGIRYFSFKDEKPLVSGYFGLRTTESRQEIRDLKIYSLK